MSVRVGLGFPTRERGKLKPRLRELLAISVLSLIFKVYIYSPT